MNIEYKEQASFIFGVMWFVVTILATILLPNTNTWIMTGIISLVHVFFVIKYNKQLGAKKDGV